MSTEVSTFWQFSLRFYRRPEIPPLCIALQDEQGIDINLLFFILHLSFNQRQLTTEDVQRIDASIRDWRMKVVQPLRALRRELKPGIAPIAAQHSEALRNAIKRDELQAERLQQEALERNFPPNSIGTTATASAAAQANIAAYSAIIGTLPHSAINTLLQALAATGLNPEKL